MKISGGSSPSFFFLFVCVFLILPFIYCDTTKTAESSLETQKKIEAFTHWLDENHFQRSFDIVAIPGQGIGGVANKEITKNDFLLKVPLSKMVFSKDHIFSPSISGDTFKPFNLMMWILQERLKPDSSWKPYLDILPESFSENPLTWDRADIEFARNTGIKQFYLHNWGALTSMHEYLEKAFFTLDRETYPEEAYSFERFLWAFNAVTTRAWVIAEYDDWALIPLADMLNHRSDANEGGLRGLKQFVISSNSDYSPGEQVYDSYGKKTSYELLVTYGFLPYENEHNGVIVDPRLTQQNPVHQKLEPLVMKELPNYPKMTLREGEVPNQLFRILRLSILEEDEFHKLSAVFKFAALDLGREKRVYREAINYLQGRINQYPSDEEEISYLALPDINENRKTIIRLRMEEKRILRTIIPQIHMAWGEILVKGELPGGIQF